MGHPRDFSVDVSVESRKNIIVESEVCVNAVIIIYFSKNAKINVSHTMMTSTNR